MFIRYYQTPIGMMEITATGEFITGIQFVVEEKESKTNHVLDKGVKQLDEYFNGKRFYFDLPLQQPGTSFQQSVWQELRQIPYGEVTTYGALAKKLGNEKAVRAVGAANGQNKIPILIPCHRVTGHDGKLVGFAYGIERKRYLLNFENNHSTVTTQLSLYV